jgi:YD repeat-containing protein
MLALLALLSLPTFSRAQSPFSCVSDHISQVCYYPPSIQYGVFGVYQGNSVRAFGASREEACLMWAAITPNPSRGAFAGVSPYNPGYVSGLYYCVFQFGTYGNGDPLYGFDGDNRELKVCPVNSVMYNSSGQYWSDNRWLPNALFATLGSPMPDNSTLYPSSVMTIALTAVDYPWVMCGSRGAAIPTRNHGNSCAAGAGNPINIGIGIKSQSEVDVDDRRLRFVRTYNSGAGVIYFGGTLGKGWQHNFAMRLSIANVVSARRGDGRIVEFAASGSNWVSWADVNDRLVELTDGGGVRTGWKYIAATTGDIETYDAAGTLVALSTRDGRVFTLAYTDGTAGGSNGGVIEVTGTALPRGLLLRVSDSFGTALSFGYDAASRFVRLTRSDGREVRFSYDAIGNLSVVRHPDIDAGGEPVLRTRTYLYENPAFPSALTGIVDESGQRLSTYTFDGVGRAVATEWAGGANRHAVTLNGDGTTVVTDPLGTQRTYAFNNQFGVVRVASQSQPGGAGCGPSSSSITYDSQANVTSRTDFTNRKTCYANDLTRNLETARVEGLTSAATCPTDLTTYVPAAGTEQRKQLTQWHPDWRLETRRAEPKKLTTWVYNGQPDPTAGNAITTCAPTDALVDGKPIAVVCKQVEQATIDETGGAGFSATAVGTARIQRWTYNRWGQVLTANGPRTDNPGGRDDLTTYEYYADTQTDWTMGDLKQVTNALGHITRYPKYDRNGRLLQQIDPNGTVTDYAYTPRGWLREVKLTPAGSSTSQSTVYEYDPVGQLTRATLPDGTSTTYTYDAARRLTDVADSAGNRVSYTLDAMGNRTKEEWKDPGGALKKTITRTIDALNRVQQVVGAVQ